MRGFNLRSRKLPVMVFLIIVAVITPWFMPDAFTYILGLTCLFMILTVSWDLMVGYTGQVNLGHTVFVGIGAYTTALLQVPSRFQGTFLSPLAGMPEISIFATIFLGGIAAGIVGFIIGVITLRLRGWYFALVTAVLPLVFIETTVIWREIFGGEEGFSVGLEKALAPASTGKYYIALIIMLISVAIMFTIVNSRIGLKFKAIRDDLDLAEAVGIDTVKYKVLAFVISSFFAGIAGAAIVHYRVTVSPDLYDVPLMLLIILAAVIGGLGTIFGPLIGGLIIYLTKYWWLKGAMATIAATGLPINDDIILYAILVVIAILAPEGLWIKAKKLAKR